MLCLQVLHSGLVLLILAKDAVDEAKAVEVIVNQHILIRALEVKSYKVLIDLQAFRKWVIGSSKIGFHEVLGGQPPGIGLAFHIVGIGLFLIVFRHAVEHELE